ncbi:hypothetical protein [Rhodococcus sp. CX]|uniref:hypothetical protein n=1 Tax=Rhodococcus sp. CX TaxID=2789880 RepID=UPI001E5A8AD6|nr:hypothetical protein [Rhodococcus sp. CX]
MSGDVARLYPVHLHRHRAVPQQGAGDVPVAEGGRVEPRVGGGRARRPLRRMRDLPVAEGAHHERVEDVVDLDGLGAGGGRRGQGSRGEGKGQRGSSAGRHELSQDSHRYVPVTVW